MPTTGSRHRISIQKQQGRFVILLYYIQTKYKDIVPPGLQTHFFVWLFTARPALPPAFLLRMNCSPCLSPLPSPT